MKIGNEEQFSSISFSGEIVSGCQIIQGYLSIENGIITVVRSSKPQGEIIDLGDAYIVLGFIDLHIHGLHYSLIDKGVKDLEEISRILPRYGVTGFLPTVAPRPKCEDAFFLNRLSKTEVDGAQILTFHLEGPFLKITGSLTAEAVSGSDTDRVNGLIETDH